MKQNAINNNRKQITFSHFVSFISFENDFRMRHYNTAYKQSPEHGLKKKKKKKNVKLLNIIIH